MEDSKKKAMEKKAIEKDMKKKGMDMVAKQTDETPKKKTYQKKQKPVMARPKYLNWKIYDNFEKINDDNLFLDGKLEKPLTPKQWHDLKEKTQQLRDKYGPILRDLFAQWEGQKQDRLVIAGGNYTFFFVLPQAVRWIRDNYPFLGIELKLFERGGNTSLKSQNADIILTSSQMTDPGFSNEELNEAGYVKTRRNAQDALYFAASTDSIEEFGSKEKVLGLHDVLFGRLYATQNITVEMHRLYSVIPEGRGDFARVITDQYFLEHVMLLHNVGVGYLYTSMLFNEKIITLSSDYVEKFKRFVIMKKNLNNQYRSIGRMLVQIVEQKGGFYEKSDD